MEKSFLRIALCFSLVGLFSLIVFSQFTEPEHIKIILLGDNIGKEVIISGQIIKITQKEEVNFFTLKDNTGQINVVAFGNMTKIKKNSNVEIIGKVEIYKSELEIIANQIKLL